MVWNELKGKAPAADHCGERPIPDFQHDFGDTGGEVSEPRQPAGEFRHWMLLIPAMTERRPPL
jgi:hypothetical protein